MDSTDRLDERECLEVVVVGLQEKTQTSTVTEELIKRLDQLQNDIAFISWMLDSNWGGRERWEARTGLKTTPSVVYIDRATPAALTTVNVPMPDNVLVPKPRKSFWGGNGKAKEERKAKKDYGDWGDWA
jgi:hypothetical protein